MLCRLDIRGGISALLVCLHSQFSGTMVADFLCLERMASTYPFFFMGFMIKNYGLNKWLFTNELLYIGCLLFVVIFLIKPLPIPGLNYWVPIAIIIVLMSFLYSLESSSSKFFKLLSTVGRSTLDIYILHYFVLTMFSLGFINQFFKSGNYSVFLEILVTTIVSSIIIVVCMFVSKLFRKSKYINKYVFNQV